MTTKEGVLQRVSAGKITVGEADLLLQAMTSPRPSLLRLHQPVRTAPFVIMLVVAELTSKLELCTAA